MLPTSKALRVRHSTVFGATDPHILQHIDLEQVILIRWTGTFSHGAGRGTGFCKQQLWPLCHYLLPLSPTSSGRFDPELWQAYVKANKVRRRAELETALRVTWRLGCRVRVYHTLAQESADKVRCMVR